MLTVLSPAKKLLNFSKPYAEHYSTPMFLNKTGELIEILKGKTESDIMKLMTLSSSLAKLNYERYQAFKTEESPVMASYPAIYFFQGDVYQTLRSAEWDSSTLEFAQNHLAILSGLYGLLRPLDLIQAYRLEMGTRLHNAAGATLYDFWQDTITAYINEQLKQHKEAVLVNLASTEYSKSIDIRALKFPVINIQFIEDKGGQQKVIGIFSKKARGMMARYIMQEKIDNVEAIKDFHESGYKFALGHSNENQFTFIRKH